MESVIKSTHLRRAFMKAVVPARGLDVRPVPYTRSQPKEMVPVVDKSAIDYAVEETVAAEILGILIFTQGKRLIQEHFNVQKDFETLSNVWRALGRVQGCERPWEPRDGSLQPSGGAIRSWARGGRFTRLRGPRGVRGDCQGQFVHPQPARPRSPSGDCAVRGRLCHRWFELAKRERRPKRNASGKDVESAPLGVEAIVEKLPPVWVRVYPVTIWRSFLQPASFAFIHRVEPDSSGEAQFIDGLRGSMDEGGLHA